jgi:hypothetical protein
MSHRSKFHRGIFHRYISLRPRVMLTKLYLGDMSTPIFLIVCFPVKFRERERDEIQKVAQLVIRGLRIEGVRSENPGFSNNK